MKVALLDPVNTIPLYVKNLGNALQRSGVEVTLYSGSYGREPEYHCHQAYRWERPHRLRRGSSKFEKLFESRSVWKKLSNDVTAGGFDLVHVQWLPVLPYAPIELGWLRRLRSCGVPLVYTVHNLLPHDRDSRYLRWAYRKAYHGVDHLIAHTRKTQAALAEEFAVDEGHISIVPHGVEAPSVIVGKHEARERLGIPREAALLLLFGVIRPYKGVLESLDAFDRIHRALPHARLLIAGPGSGEYLERIRERIAQLGLEPFVLLHDRFIEEELVPLYFSSADLALFPYLEIDQSGALMTAFAHRTPVLATALEAFRETIVHGETGLLSPPGRMDAFADAAIAALRNPERLAELGLSGYRSMMEKSSWEQAAQRSRAVYQKVKELSGR